MAFAERLAALRSELDAELRALGRDPASVAVLGVSKKQPPAALAEALDAGLASLGENYVQEAADKLAALRQGFDGLEALRYHFIGHVQTNKAKKIVETFDVVQSVDRPDAARALAKAAAAAGKQLPVLIQLNISPSERFGCPPGQAQELAGLIRGYEALRLDGVMAVGPITGDNAVVREAFALAAKTLRDIGGSTLSIGMSGDWREAVAAGSTMIRIGTALFGERPRH